VDKEGIGAALNPPSGPTSKIRASGAHGQAILATSLITIAHYAAFQQKIIGNFS
jgi:hypothetical protein